MNRERAKKLLPIIQAFAEGKEIEYKSPSHINPRDKWDSIEKDHDLDIDQWLYRIKPEPREFTVVIYADDDKRAYNGWAPYVGVGGEELIKVREVIEELK